jgi:hypothetical protein
MTGDDLKKEIKKELDHLVQKSEFEKSMGQSEYSISYAPGIVDDIAEICSKTDEERELEEQETIHNFIKTLEAYSKTNPQFIPVQPTGYLADDYVKAEELHENLRSDPAKYGFQKKGALWFYPAMWDDVMFTDHTGEKHCIWTVQTKKYLEENKKAEIEYYNLNILEAANPNEILKLKKEIEQTLKDIEEYKDDFWNVTIDQDYLDRKGVIKGVRIWFERYFPKLKDVPIKVKE